MRFEFLLTFLLAGVVLIRAEEPRTLISRALKAAAANWRDFDELKRDNSSHLNQYTEIDDVCDRLESLDHAARVACSEPKNTRYIYNARIDTTNITFFYGGANDIVVANGLQNIALPAIETVTQRVKKTFNLKVMRSPRTFGNGTCSSSGIIDGTLHVIGLETAHNLFHAMNDNILPLMAQIVLDAFLHPTFLHKPRYLIILGANDAAATSPPSSASSTNSKRGVQLVPHLSLLSDVATDRILLDRAHCFRRIVWGNGPRVLYHPELGTLRRYATDLLRELVKARYDPPLPKPFAAAAAAAAAAASATLGGTTTATGAHALLKATVFSRDATTGRSFQGEGKIVDFLKSRGVLATLCTSPAAAAAAGGKYNPSGGSNNPQQQQQQQREYLQQQLGLSYHSDIIISLHGAGLANAAIAPRGALIVELKTVYAYNTDFYALLAAGRAGSLAHIDMRGYQLAKGMRAVDEPLLQRIGAAIITFRELGKSTNSELYRPLEGEYRGQRYDDGVYMVSRFKGFDDNVLGPPEKAVSSQAKLSDWQLYWKHVRGGRPNVSPTIF